MKLTQTFNALPSVEVIQRYMPKAVQDFALDPTDPPEPTQVYQHFSKAVQDFTLEPTLTYADPDTSSPSLSLTPRSDSGSPKKVNKPTSNSVFFSAYRPKLKNKKQNASDLYMPRNTVFQQIKSRVSKHSIPAKPKRKSECAIYSETSTLKVSKKGKESKDDDRRESKPTRYEAFSP